jgi:2,4'-dihydroxyacetophenone dioxygenase
VKHQQPSDGSAKQPYLLPPPQGVIGDIVIPQVVPGDERVWVAQEENVWFRPLCLNVTHGYWVNLLRVRRAGVLTRHRHAGPVHGHVLKGRWYYAEHDWTAEAGSYVFEPPGQTHTLIVPDDVEEMITLFQVNGAMIYVDPYGEPTGYDDVLSKVELCREYYRKVGLGTDFVDQFIR